MLAAPEFRLPRRRVDSERAHHSFRLILQKVDLGWCQGRGFAALAEFERLVVKLYRSWRYSSSVLSCATINKYTQATRKGTATAPSRKTAVHVMLAVSHNPPRHTSDAAGLLNEGGMKR